VRSERSQPSATEEPMHLWTEFGNPGPQNPGTQNPDKNPDKNPKESGDRRNVSRFWEVPIWKSRDLPPLFEQGIIRN